MTYSNYRPDHSPYVYIRRLADKSIANYTDVIIEMDTVVENENGCWNPATNTYTAPKAGRINITVGVCLNSPTAGLLSSAIIHHNKANVLQGINKLYTFSSLSGQNSMSNALVLSVNEGDYFQLSVYTFVAGTVMLGDATIGALYNYVKVYYLP